MPGRAVNEPSGSSITAWRRPLVGAFNKGEALVGAFSGHYETSRKFIDTSSAAAGARDDRLIFCDVTPPTQYILVQSCPARARTLDTSTNIF